MISTPRALVLAGGGVAGIAWETGFLTGLHDEVPSLVDSLLDPSTTLIGTSAGSTVAAQLASGATLDELFERQTSDETAELFVEVDFAEFGARMFAATAGATTPVERRQRVGAVALAAETVAPATRRAVIEARLAGLGRPSRPLLIPAVDALSGEMRVFDETTTVDLVDVVAASCAVPGIWPPVEIEGRLYVDGGVRTVANADLAAGASTVLILVPSAPTSPLGLALPDDELAALAPAAVHSVFADDESLEAMGANPLDPASRIPTARAGRLQGRRAAASVAAFWQ